MHWVCTNFTVDDARHTDRYRERHIERHLHLLVIGSMCRYEVERWVSLGVGTVRQVRNIADQLIPLTLTDVRRQQRILADPGRGSPGHSITVLITQSLSSVKRGFLNTTRE